MAAVAIEFPSGTIVMILYTLLWGGGVVGVALWLRAGRSFRWVKTLGEWPVLQLYFASYCIGLAVVIIWVIKSKGFKSRSQSEN